MMKRETSYISLRIKTIHCFWNAIRWYRLPAGEWSAIKAACCLTLCYFDLEQGYNIWTGRKGTWIMQNKADRENRRRVKIISTDNVIHNRLTCPSLFVSLAKCIRMGCTSLHAIHMHKLRDMNRASKHRAYFTWQRHWIWRYYSQLWYPD